jgi:hypothetical protein
MLSETRTRPVRASAARSAAGHPARKTAGSASAVILGTPSTREARALPAFASGLKLTAPLAAAGRRIRCGMRSEKMEAHRPQALALSR